MEEPAVSSDEVVAKALVREAGAGSHLGIAHAVFDLVERRQTLPILASVLFCKAAGRVFERTRDGRAEGDDACAASLGQG